MEKYVSSFNKYISNFDLDKEELYKKKIHTYQVVMFSEAIARSLNLNEEDQYLASIIGLYHDIGRFYQYEKYHSFRDYENVDHADVGVEILKSEKIFDDYKDKDIVFKAIKNHNKFRIEEGLTDRELLFCKIIRDADKLDILNQVISKKIPLKQFNENYSYKAVNEIMNNRCILVSDYENNADKSLVRIAMISDLNFDYSKKFLIEKNIIDKLIEVYGESNPIEKQTLNKMKVKIKERLSE